MSGATSLGLTGVSLFDPDRNAQDGYALALAAIRERRVRAGEISPRNDQERRWADEGAVAPSQLDTVRAGL